MQRGSVLLLRRQKLAGFCLLCVRRLMEYVAEVIHVNTLESNVLIMLIALYTALLLSTLHCWNSVLLSCAFIGFRSSGVSTCCEAKPIQLTSFVILWPFGLHRAIMMSLQLLGITSAGKEVWGLVHMGSAQWLVQANCV